jgi:F-type H+-transporting ATPase subunit b
MKIHPSKVVLWLIFWACYTTALAMEESGPHEAQEAGKEGVFTGYWGESFWTLVWFLALLAVLWKFAWKPLLAGLRGREEHIEKQISDAEKTKTEAKQTLDEYRAQLADADRQGREIITRRVKEAEEQAREVQAQSQKEIDRIKVRMEADIERERSEVEQDLWEQAGIIIQRLGSEIFKKTLDDADNRKLIEEAIARLREVDEKKP